MPLWDSNIIFLNLYYIFTSNEYGINFLRKIHLHAFVTMGRGMAHSGKRSLYKLTPITFLEKEVSLPTFPFFPLSQSDFSK